MSKKSQPVDELLAKYLDTPEAIAAYLDEALATGTEADFLLAIKNVARLTGMTHLAEQTGLSRESMYKTLSETGNPKLDTLSLILHHLGLRLSVTPDETGSHAA